MIGKTGMLTRRYIQPGPVSGLTAVRAANQYTLSWSAPTNDYGLPVNDYEVVVTRSVGATIVSTFRTGGSRSAVISGFQDGYYENRVAAVNDAGATPASSNGDGPVLTAASFVNSRIGPQLVTVTENSIGASVSGVGDDDSNLTVSVVNKTSGTVTIAAVNAQQNVFVSWNLQVALGSVRVTTSDYTSTISDGNTSAIPSSGYLQLGIAYFNQPVSFTLRAYI